MALTTRDVAVSVLDAAGAPVAGAVVTARLDRADIDPAEGVVTPSDVAGTTDGAGAVTLALWPNLLGTANSVYRFEARSADDELLFLAWGRLPDADTSLAAFATFTDPHEPPVQTDFSRGDRIQQDILDMLHQDAADPNTVRLVRRWMKHVTDYAARRRWWFLERVAVVTLSPGADVAVFAGAVDKVSAVFADGYRVPSLGLSTVLEHRVHAQRLGLANAGPVGGYALEAGRKLHFWPAPRAVTGVTILYQRPFDLALLPDALEQMIVHGVLGRYGRHFDRDALAQDPEWFERRFLADLREAQAASFDALSSSARWQQRTAEVQAATLGAIGAVDTLPAPASLTGTGYVTIETGDYPLRVS